MIRTEVTNIKGQLVNHACVSRRGRQSLHPRTNIYFSPYTKKIHTYNNIYHKNIDNYSYTNYKYLQTLYMNTSLVEVL